MADISNIQFEAWILEQQRSATASLSFTVEHGSYNGILSRMMTGLNLAIQQQRCVHCLIQSQYSIFPLFKTPFVGQSVPYSRFPLFKMPFIVRSLCEDNVVWDFFKDTWNAPTIVRNAHQYPECPIKSNISRHQWCAVLAHTVCGHPTKQLQDVIKKTKKTLHWDSYDLHIGLHVRRGDKNTEVPYIAKEKYCRFVESILDRNANTRTCIFLTSDDPSSFMEFANAFPGVDVLWDSTEERYNNYNADMISKKKFAPKLSYDESVTCAKNISLLGECDHVVGMASAQFTWIGGLLCVFRHNLDVSRHHMIDAMTGRRGHWGSSFGHTLEMSS
jgi:Alpha-(1,6)-fucosyltransferase N- and catalytic domains